LFGGKIFFHAHPGLDWEHNSELPTRRYPMTSAEEYKEAFDKANEEEKEKHREENQEYENQLREHMDYIRRRQIELFGRAPHLD
jgi:hypothetical protein